MPLNIPTGDTNNISFGPAVVKMGAAGVTPVANVGFISEDGVSVELTSEKKQIYQGNPKTLIYAFTQQQGVSIKFTSIEWDFDRFIFALGSGTTAAGTGAGGVDFFFGGEPLVTYVALHIEHAMGSTVDTMEISVWKALSDSGFSTNFNADEGAFEFSFQACRAETDWAGVALTSGRQFVKFSRIGA